MPHSRDAVGGEVDDATDEVLTHNHAPDGLPVGGVLPKQQTDGLKRDLDCIWRIGHASHLDQVLLLDRLDGWAATAGFGENRKKMKLTQENQQRAFCYKQRNKTEIN